MEKLLYWLRKIGVVRSASYSVKGDAKKLVEMDATDGGMIQSQGHIDAEYQEKKGDGENGHGQHSQLPEKNTKNSSKKEKFSFGFLSY